MRENQLSYDEIVNYFGKAKIADRYKYLYDKMKEYISARGLQGKLIIHESILQQVVMDYYCDIYRLKEFHKIDKITVNQIISYTSFWILRRKPIIPDPEVNESHLIFSNENFVTVYLAHEMLPDGEEPLSAEEEEHFLDYLRHLNYHLRYRNVDKQTLEIIIYSYQCGRRMPSE